MERAGHGPELIAQNVALLRSLAQGGPMCVGGLMAAAATPIRAKARSPVRRRAPFIGGRRRRSRRAGRGLPPGGNPAHRAGGPGHGPGHGRNRPALCAQPHAPPGWAPGRRHAPVRPDPGDGRPPGRREARALHVQLHPPGRGPRGARPGVQPVRRGAGALPGRAGQHLAPLLCGAGRRGGAAGRCARALGRGHAAPAPRAPHAPAGRLLRHGRPAPGGARRGG